MESLRRLKQAVETMLDIGPSHQDSSTPDAMMRHIRQEFVPKLKDAVGDVGKKVSAVHSLGSDKSQIPMVHYTSLAVVMSMLENSANDRSSAFRLYDSVHLNDPDEGRYLFRSLPSAHSWLEATRDQAYIASFIRPRDKEDPGRAADNLSFWRTYGNEGTGCSLSLMIPSTQVRKVLYGRLSAEATWDRFSPVLEQVDRLIEGADKAGLKTARMKEELARSVSEALASIRYLYKSDAYAYERECRVVQSDQDEDQLRFECKTPPGRPAYIRRYCEPEDLSLHDLLPSGTSIFIGPRVPNQESVRYCLRVLLSRAKIPGPDVRFSEISYQAF